MRERHESPNFFSKKISCHWYSPFKEVSKKSLAQKLKKAFLCGDKKGIKRSRLKAYKKLNLYHLFTPSGIHYGAILLVLTPLIKILECRYKYLSFGLKSFFFLGPWLLNDFFSLKRIGSMKFIKLLPLFKDLKFIHIFLIYFLFDYFLGTRTNSPMSFNFSFLFIGIIACAANESYLKLSLYLFLGQMIYCSIFFTKLNPLSFLFSFSLTAIFSPFFILTALENFLPKFEILLSVTDFFIIFYDQMVQFCFNLISNVPEIIPTLALACAIFCFLNSKKRLGILLILLYSPNTLNISSGRFKQGLYTFQTSYYMNKNQIKRTYMKRGKKHVEFKNKRICRFTVYQYGESKKCHFKKI